MKKVILLLIGIIPFYNSAQYTFVPDDNFELALLNLGFDFVLDDYVETAAVDTITDLQINNKDIYDLTGIEDFISLSSLFCYDNNLTTLNLTNNTQLFEVTCSNNDLISIDLRNGNNTNLWYFQSFNNPNLNCIDVDDVTWCEYNFAVDTWTSFSNNCNSTGIDSKYSNKRLIKILDVNGRITQARPNIPLLYFYDDGTVEKRIYIQ